MPATIAARTNRKISDGRFSPLGATLTDGGVNFAIYSRHATAVHLLLFDEPTGEPTDVIPLEAKNRYIWHVFVHGIGAGQLYGYRVSGPFDPRNGLRFNSNKLLLDPYAKALTGKVRNVNNLILAYDTFAPDKDLTFDPRDSVRVVPKSIVIDDAFDWQGDVPPDVPLDQSIIYEVHLKGFTAHWSSGVSKPGTYLGFIEKIGHLKELGITAVELLPIQEFYVEDRLVRGGLTNYWGYNTIAFFSPEISYSSCSHPGCQVREFKTLVRELHRAGIEVILDVVYNHTGEGNEQGPTVSLRGIDNPSYYALERMGDAPARGYVNYSGCGNTIDASSAPVMRLVADSLRYWVQEMHVDGFRFDLATILGRRGADFSSRASFFDIVSQDPVLSRVKLIAEPWDLATYQVGGFPIDWCEWNGRFRDTIRRFVRGVPGQIGDLGWRLCGSEDLYADDGRTAHHSINFVTCHDGFTLADLVSYDSKHNEANQEDNRDGTTDNVSNNYGVEGETTDPAITRIRWQQAKNLLSLLLLSSGTPMVLGGDEFLRTQGGNNNAYCQDNATSWFDWRLLDRNRDFFEFVKKLLRLTRHYKALQLNRAFDRSVSSTIDRLQISWFGRKLDPPAWHDPNEKTLVLQIHARQKRGQEFYLLVIFNADTAPQTIRLPGLPDGFVWLRKIDTSLPAGKDILERGSEVEARPADAYVAGPRSTVLLIARGGERP